MRVSPHSIHAPRLVRETRQLIEPGALGRIRAWLARHVPELEVAGATLWADLARSLTATELDEMRRSGLVPGVARETLSAWIARQVVPRWRRTIEHAAAAVVDASVRELISASVVESWIAERRAGLISDLSTTQREAVEGIIRYQAAAGVDQRTLAVMLRSSLGLTPRQADALAAMHRTLVADGVEGDALRLALARRANRQQRVRSSRIARTELAAAYNGAVDVAMTRASDSGTFAGSIVRVWSVQPDERTCQVCEPLDGVARSLGRPWPGGIDHPPAHPSCRCVVLYEERE